MHTLFNATRISYVVFAILILSCCWSQNTYAQHNWIGATGNWSDAANWSGGSVPTSGSANLSITFDNPTAFSTATQDFGAPFELQEMIFNNGMYVEGSPIRFKNLGAGPRLISNSGFGYWIRSDLVLDDTVTLDSTGGVSANYISGNISGMGGIVKNGTDSLQLRGSNSFSGGITINEGSITSSTAGFNNNDVVFNDPGTVAGVRISFDQSFDGTYSGDVSGGGSLEKTGSGTLTLGGNNSYTGYTAIGTGTLRLDSANALSANSSGLSIGQNATLDLNGFDATINNAWTDGTILLGSGNLIHNLNKSNTVIEGIIAGAGSYTIQNATFPTWQVVMNNQSTHTGGTNVDGATLILGASERFADEGDITLTNGSTFDIGTHSETLRNLTLNDSCRIVGTGTITSSESFRFDSVSNIAFDASLAGTGELIKSGSGWLALNGTNSYSGHTTINQGELIVQPGNFSGDVTVEAEGELAFLGTGSGTASGVMAGAGDVSISNGTMTFTGQNTYTGETRISGTLILGGFDAISPESKLIFANGGNLDINNHQMTVSKVQGEGDIDLGDIEGAFIVNSNFNNNYIDGEISGNGGLYVTGGGQLALRKWNTFTGSVGVDGAILRSENSGLQNATIVELSNGAELSIQGNLLTNGDFSMADGSVNGGSLTAASFQVQSGFINSRLKGAGTLTKSGLGDVRINNSQDYTGGTFVYGGKLIGDMYSLLGDIDVGANGTLEVNQTSDFFFGNNFHATLSGAGTVVKTGHTDLILYQPSTSFTGTFQHTEGNLVVTDDQVFGSGKLVLNKDVSIESTGGPRTFTNETEVAGGMLFTGTEAMDFTNVSLVRVRAGETLRNDNTGGTILIGRFQGDADSIVSAEAGSFSLGDSSSYVGFRTSGEIHVANGASLTANSASFIDMGPIVSLSGGTLNAANGIAVGAAENLIGHGTINAKIAAQTGSVIAATTGNLTIGSVSAVDGFFSDGIMITNDNTVVVNDLNAAVLGSLTRLGNGTNGGRLEAGTALTTDAHDHFFVEEGKNVTGRGFIAGNFKNNGLVQGDGTAAGELLVFESPWTVSGKGTFENVQIDGTFAPGESPGIVDSTNLTLGGNLEIELGGLTPGFGSGHHDLIRDSAAISLLSSATLDILAWDNFIPNIGDEFVVMTWESSLNGQFASFQFDPFFSQNGIQFQVQYNNVNGPGNVTLAAFSSVPEPGSAMLLCLLGVAVVLRRRRETQAN